MVTQPTAASQTDAAPFRGVAAGSSLHPTLAVLRWELRRVLAGRSVWASAAGVFAASVVLLLLSRQLAEFGPFDSSNTGRVVHGISGAIPWTTPFGLAILLPFSALLFALFLPFVTADGVSLDLKRRTHELLMTTAVPSRAYIWGRYLASALLSLGVAVVFLAAIVATALALFVIHPDAYPLLDLPSTLTIWALVVLPATILLSSLSFALGALLPRHTNLVKAGIVLCWFLAGEYLPSYLAQRAAEAPGFAAGQIPAWFTAYQAWDPTTVAGGQGIVLGQFQRLISPIVGNAGLSDQAVLQQVGVVELRMPDLGPLAGSHLVWAAVGLAAVALAAAAFRRFRNVIS
jgi:ABC-type transport system involved in multi-copper enzyme maturation permease subunit